MYNKNSIENEYVNLVMARRRLIEPIEKSVDSIIADFNSIKYEGKPFEDEDYTEYYTIKGERVRSKSEKKIYS